MFPLLRASPSLSIGQRDQATDGLMRTIAQPRDTASVFFVAVRAGHRRRPGRSMISKLAGFDETMRPKCPERNRDCVRTGFAPGRPPPVLPRLTGACAAMRGSQICVRGQAQMQRHALGMARATSFFTMSNSPLRDLSAQHISFPRRISAPGLVPIHSRPPRRGVGGAPTGALFRLSR